MTGIFRRFRRRFCRHADKRVWDIGRQEGGRFRLRLYCPACGERWDVVREPDEIIRDAAGDNVEMAETMRRKLDLDGEK